VFGIRLKLYVCPAKLFTILFIRYRCCIDDPTVALVGVQVILSVPSINGGIVVMA